MTVAETMTDARSLAGKFQAAERQAAEAGWPFALFALIEREDTPGQWDLVVSARWAHSDRAGIAHIIKVLSAGDLTTIDWFPISRIVPLDPSDEFVQMIARLYPVKHQMVEIPATTLGTTRINRALVFTADPSLIPAQAQAA